MDKNKTPLIYISGPYSNGDTLSEAEVEENVRNAIAFGNELMDLGYLVYIPHLSHYMEKELHREHSEWISYDLKWINLCDVILRIGGRSLGAALEVIYAENHKIPVFYDLDQMLRAFPSPAMKGEKNGNSTNKPR